MILKNTKISLALSILFVIGSAGVFGVSLYLISKKSTELNTQVAAIAESTAVTEEYNKLNVLLEDTESERTKLKEFILSESEIINFLSEVEKISRSFGLKVETNSLNVVEGSGFFDTLELELGFVGEAKQVFKFLEFVEALPYASTVAGYSYSIKTTTLDGRDELTGAVQLRVQIHSYE